tara:strand:- start:1223 stop:2101 length:879 start_codon:yes stop_codon:yes gene_type:complete
MKHLLAGSMLMPILMACQSMAEDDVSAFGELSGHIIIAGDSTAADYPADRAPQVGWGQAIDFYLADGVTVDNRAVNGRSTKSYIDEGKWAALLETVTEGDLVLISFGHNDSRDDAPERYAAADGDYRENLIGFTEDVKARGAYPVILSSPARRLWEGPAMVETHGLYRLNAERAAVEAEAGYIDLAQLSMTYFEGIGREETKADFFWLSANEVAERYPALLERYEEGVEDNTHFREIGACGVARIIANQLKSEIASAEKLVNPAAFSGAGETRNGRPADVYGCADNIWEADN